jgi:hypothetical protein
MQPFLHVLAGIAVWLFAIWFTSACLAPWLGRRDD